MKDALSLWKTGDYNDSLRRLNSLWEETRCPALAEQIERLGSHVASLVEPIQTKGRPRQLEWERRCCGGDLVGIEHVLGIIRNGTSAQIKRRFDMLRERSPDPRMTSVVFLFANELHMISRSPRPAWTAFFRLVIHIKDPRSKKPLLALAELAEAANRLVDASDFPAYLLKQIRAALASLPAPGTFAPLEVEMVDAVLQAPAAPIAHRGSIIDDLYAKVLADPADLDLLHVWTDALLEVDDERGMFARLQLLAEERALTPKEEKLAAKLLKNNYLRWMGEASSYLEFPINALFRRGLLDSAILHHNAPKSALGIREFRSVSQLATRKLDLLTHENLVSLSRLGNSATPRPHSATGPVGFRFSYEQVLHWNDIKEAAALGLAKITHLEFFVEDSSDITSNTFKAFPNLQTVLLAWDANDLREVLTCFSDIRDVIFREGYRHISDAFALSALPAANIHLGDETIFRSYLRNGDCLDVVITDLGRPGGLGADSQLEAIISDMPPVSSLSFRQLAGWPQDKVDAIANAAQHIKDVTLPRVKRARKT